MFEVKLNERELRRQAGALAGPFLTSALNSLGEYAKERIFELASSKLTITQQQKYFKAFKQTKTATSIKFEITDPLQEYIEWGSKQTDLKPGLIAGPSAKMGKTGPYTDVPFYHRTTKRGTGSYAGARVLNAPVLRRAINKALRSIEAGAEPFRIFKRQPGQVVTRYTDMLIGRPSTGRLAGRATAMTFRRVSRNSSPESWIRRGFEPLKIFATVAQEVEAAKDKMVSDLLAQAGVK